MLSNRPNAEVMLLEFLTLINYLHNGIIPLKLSVGKAIFLPNNYKSLAREFKFEYQRKKLFSLVQVSSPKQKLWTKEEH